MQEQAPARRRILFVDDEPNVLAGLRRLFRPLRKQWEVKTASSGQEALALLAKEHFDVVVSDMRMPRMNGAQLLGEVSTLQPDTVRMILTGQANESALIQAAGTTHQVLAKPCDADVLVHAVERSFELRGLLESERLQALVAGLHTLPALPSLYMQIAAALRSERASTEAIGELVAQDMGMSAKLLQVVNSAYFGRSQPLADPARAAVLLGVDAVRGLVLDLHLFDELDGAHDAGVPMTALFSHGLSTARLARTVATDLDLPKSATEEAYLSGLLHDVGLLVLSANEPATMKSLMDVTPEDWRAAEIEGFGATHAEVGAYLLGLWGLPDTVVEAVAFHHRAPEADAPIDVLGCVQIADCLLTEPVAGVLGHEAEALTLDALAPTQPSLHDAWRDQAAELLERGVENA